MTNLEKLRAAIIKAVPEILEYDCGRHQQPDLDCIACRYRAPSLADVLRAIPHMSTHDGRNIVVGQAESIGNRDFITAVSMWNLTKNLDDQSPETIDFLTSVLCNK